MATSQNGWYAFDSYGAPQLQNLSWVSGKVNKACHAIFELFCTDFNVQVERIDLASSWGFAPRPIRGSTTQLSNHASGTAVDLNAPRHPLSAAGTFSAAQVKKIQALLEKYGHAIRWGGNYAGRKDEMHFEIDTNPDRVAEVVEIVQNTPPTTPPVPGIVKKQLNSMTPNGSTTFPTDYEDLILDKDLGRLTVGAYQILLHALGHRNNKQWDGGWGTRTIKDAQERLQKQGYYLRTSTGAQLRVDGGDGYYFWYEVQRMLTSKGLYGRALDGVAKGWTIHGLQRWLNTQNGS